MAENKRVPLSSGADADADADADTESDIRVRARIRGRRPKFVTGLSPPHRPDHPEREVTVWVGNVADDGSVVFIDFR